MIFVFVFSFVIVYNKKKIGGVGMRITVEQLYKIVKKPTSIRKGSTLYQNNLVQDFIVEQIEKLSYELYGSVREGKKIYKPHLIINPFMELSHFECTCPHKDLPCEHASALLFKALYETKKHPMYEQKDKHTIQLLKSYELIYDINLQRKYEKQNLQLLPILSDLDKQTLLLSFSIGSDCFYQLKSVANFIEDMIHHTSKSYQGELSVLHIMENFNESSQQMISYLIQNAEQGAFLRSHSSQLIDARFFMVSAHTLDNFMQLFLGKSVPFSTATGVFDHFVIDMNPSLTLVIDSKDHVHTAALSIEDYCYYEGTNYGYLHSKNTIFRCDTNFHNNCKILLTTLTKVHKLRIEDEDMHTFYKNVIESVKDYVTIEGNIQQYAPKPFRSKLNLDMHNRILSGNLYFDYGTQVYAEADNNEHVHVRDEHKEHAISHMLATYAVKRDATNTFIFSESEQSSYQFLSTILTTIPDIFEISLSKSIQDLQIQSFPKVKIEASIQDAMLCIRLDNSLFELAELFEILQRYREDGKYFVLSNGIFLSLNNACIWKLNELMLSIHATPAHIINNQLVVPKFRIFSFQASLASTTFQFNRDAKFREIVRSVSSMNENQYEAPASYLPILRNYQKSGYRWLRSMFANGFHPILADDMGMGKSIQTLAILEADRLHKTKNPSIIICPSYRLLSWEHKLHTYSPQQRVITIQGNAELRLKLFHKITKTWIVLISYEDVKTDLHNFLHLYFTYCILDEAQSLNHMGTRISWSIKQLRSEHRLALTSTSLKSSLSTLWNVFDFLIPSYLFDDTYFKTYFDFSIKQQKNMQRISELANLVDPFILKRTKLDLQKELPGSSETLLYLLFDDEAKALYKMDFKPYIRDARKDINADRLQTKKIHDAFRKIRSFCCAPSLLYTNYNGHLTKLNACLEILYTAKENGKKVFVFSHFPEIFGILEKELTNVQISSYAIKKDMEDDIKELLSMPLCMDADVLLLPYVSDPGLFKIINPEIVIHFDPSPVHHQNMITEHHLDTILFYDLVMKDSFEETLYQLFKNKVQPTLSSQDTSDVLCDHLTKEELLSLF